MIREVAVYKGDQLLAMGSLKQCAKKLGVKPDTIRFYTTPVYARRVAKRKTTSGNYRTVVVI